MDFTSLPEDVHRHILSMLDAAELAQVSSTASVFSDNSSSSQWTHHAGSHSVTSAIVDKVFATFRWLSVVDLSGCVNLTDISGLHHLGQRNNTLQHLSIARTAVSDLSPLGHCEGLLTLDIGGTPVDDLAPLSACRSLQQLNASLTRVSSVAPLDGAPNLTVLTLDSTTRLVSMEAIGSLPALRYLSLAQTSIENLDFVSGTPQLEYLDISSTKVDVVCLHGQASRLHTLVANCLQAGDHRHYNDACQRIHCGPCNVQSLYLKNWKNFSDVAPLHSFAITSLDVSGTSLSTLGIGNLNDLNVWPNLRTINISHTAITDVHCLSGSSHLTSFVAKCSRLQSLCGLERKAQLRHVNVCQSPELTSLEPLSTADRLFSVNVALTGVEDLSSLSHLCLLEEIDCSNSQIISVAVLATCPALKYINVYETKISDLRPLARCNRLQKLVGGGSKWDAPDVAPLSNCEDLTVLHLPGAKCVQDASSLANCRSLKDLNLSKTSVSDLGFVTTMAELGSLVLSHCPITSVEPAADCKSLHTLEVDFTQVKDVGCLVNLPSLRKLNVGGCAVSNISQIARLPNVDELYFNIL